MSTIKIQAEKEYTVEELEALIAEAKKPKPKPKRWFYPNGAVGTPLEKGEEYYYYFYDDLGDQYTTSDIWRNYDSDYNLLNLKRVFLDEKTVELALEVKKIHNKILRKVMEINFENDWREDWGDENQDKHSLSSNKYGQFYHCYTSTDTYISTHTYMCYQAMDWLLSDEVTDFERACFLKNYYLVKKFKK